jgi:probable HAF family extracellular repeat protein
MTIRCRSHIIFFLAIGASCALAQPKYSAKPLGGLGGNGADARGLNDAGHVTGGSYIAGNTAVHAFLYDGSMHDLGTLGGDGSAGFGINQLGWVTGTANLLGNTYEHAFLYNGTMHDLGTLEGGSSVGFGINNMGQVVGYSYPLGTQAFHAFLYDGVTMHDLGPGEAFGINNKGYATGTVISGATSQAFLYDPTTHALSGFGPNGGVGHSINDLGQIAGTAQMAGDSALHAFIYDGTTMRDLGTLGGLSSDGLGINDAGHVVGYSDTPTSQHAFLFDGISMYDLNNLVTDSPATFHFAFGINDLGQIIADDYAGQAYLLTPISPPVIRDLSTSPSILWPPNHQYVQVTINYTVISSDPATCGLSVSSNEPGSEEWIVVDAHHVMLRAERDGNGVGRQYVVTINCANQEGNTNDQVTVTVPHDASE